LFLALPTPERQAIVKQPRESPLRVQLISSPLQPPSVRRAS